MRFITGLFVGSVAATLLGFAVSHAGYQQQKHRLIEAEHKRIIADWDRERAEQKALDLRVQLDAERRAGRAPVHPKGAVVPAGDRIPAPAVPLPLPTRPNN